MGLDAVELVLEVEDHFRIRLTNEECSRVRSVMDLADLVVSKLSKVVGACPPARSFFALRRTAVRLTPLERNALRPSTPLDRIVPKKGRRRIWRRLRRARPTVPRLQLSAREEGFLRTVGWALFAGWHAATVALAFSQGGDGFAIGLFLGYLAAMAFVRAPDFVSTELPDRCASLGDLARRITPTPLRDGDPEAERRVLDDVRRITAEQVGLSIDDVKPESRFVDDLGID